MKEAYQQIEKEFGLKKKENFPQTMKNINNCELIIQNTPKKVNNLNF